MARIELPLQATTLWYTGERALRAYVKLLLKDGQGNWYDEVFRFDSGADITSMSAARANLLGLPMPRQGLTVPVTTAAGTFPVTVRPGLLRFKIDGLDPTEYVVPCHFLGDPQATPAGTAAIPRKLLGLSGLVDKLRISFDGTPTQAAPNGVLIVEKP